MSHYHACWACGDPGVEPDFKFCSRCAVLLDGMDLTDLPASRGPCVKPALVSPARTMISPGPRRDARWLLWAANKRGCLRFFVAFGREHGYPRNLLQWSPGMVAIAVEAKVAERQPR